MTRAARFEVQGTAPLRLTDTTISGNRAKGNGGGIDFVSGEVSLNAVTVVRNVGNSDGTLPGAEAGSSMATGSASRTRWSR